MSEQKPAEGQQARGKISFNNNFPGFGRGDKDKKGGFKGKREPRQPRDQGGDWKPLTKLGRLVKMGKITTLEEIFRCAIPIKEQEIVDFLLKDKLKEEVMQVKPVQKQTQAGQRTRFKAYVAVGDGEGHIGLGWKSAKEVQGAIKGAISNAKLQLHPVRRGYWGNMLGNAHTIPFKISGKCGSIRVRLIPAPRGTGLVASPVSKKVLQLAGIGDCFTSSTGQTKTRGNFAKAVFNCLCRTYRFQTPDWWGKSKDDEHPFESNSQLLSKVSN